jgi:hypothetical protein
LRNQARKYTKTNTTNYPDSELDADLNIANGEIHMMIMESEGYKNTGGDFKVNDFICTTGLTEQEEGYNGEYPNPTDAFRVEEYYLDYGDGHVKAEIISKSEVGSEMFQDLGGYSKARPKVFVFRDSYFTRPLLTDPTVTDGIKLLISSGPKTIVETVSDSNTETSEPQFASTFHNLVALKVAQDYYLVNPDKYNPRIDKKAQELEAQLISLCESKVPQEKKLQAVKEVW